MKQIKIREDSTITSYDTTFYWYMSISGTLSTFYPTYEEAKTVYKTVNDVIDYLNKKLKQLEEVVDEQKKIRDILIEAKKLLEQRETELKSRGVLYEREL
jgi:hypothetical protein